MDRSNVSNVEPGNISNENAEKRADIGKTRPPTFTEAQVLVCSEQNTCLPCLATGRNSARSLRRPSTDQRPRLSTCACIYQGFAAMRHSQLMHAALLAGPRSHAGRDLCTSSRVCHRRRCQAAGARGTLLHPGLLRGHRTCIIHPDCQVRAVLLPCWQGRVLWQMSWPYPCLLCAGGTPGKSLSRTPFSGMGTAPDAAALKFFLFEPATEILGTMQR